MFKKKKDLDIQALFIDLIEEIETAQFPTLKLKALEKKKLLKANVNSFLPVVAWFLFEFSHLVTYYFKSIIGNRCEPELGHRWTVLRNKELTDIATSTCNYQRTLKLWHMLLEEKKADLGLTFSEFSKSPKPNDRSAVLQRLGLYRDFVIGCKSKHSKLVILSLRLKAEEEKKNKKQTKKSDTKKTHSTRSTKKTSISNSTSSSSSKTTRQNIYDTTMTPPPPDSPTPHNNTTTTTEDIRTTPGSLAIQTVNMIQDMKAQLSETQRELKRREEARSKLGSSNQSMSIRSAIGSTSSTMTSAESSSSMKSSLSNTERRRSSTKSKTNPILTEPLIFYTTDTKVKHEMDQSPWFLENDEEDVDEDDGALGVAWLLRSDPTQLDELLRASRDNPDSAIYIFQNPADIIEFEQERKALREKYKDVNHVDIRAEKENLKNQAEADEYEAKERNGFSGTEVDEEVHQQLLEDLEDALLQLDAMG